MSRKGQIVLVVAFLATVSGGFYFYFRSVYEHSKRLRVVEPGVLYRSGQLTADGFRDAVKRYQIRTIVNVQDEVPDPNLHHGPLSIGHTKETQLCKELGVNYVWLAPGLEPRSKPGGPKPAVIDEWLAVLDDPSNFPILLHCKAGLHRTGVLTAVYRMEHHGWSRQAAYRELKAHGFGDTVCTDANDYVIQYVLTYKRRPGGDGNATDELTRLGRLGR